jgi:predicted metal-dependent enzyme (double-stranded beta helix superfamily)
MMVGQLEQFGLRLRGLIDRQPESERLIAGARELVSQLTGSTSWLGELFERLLFDRAFLDGQTNSIWPNEFSLLRDPDGQFSVVAYVWEPGNAPGITGVVHDHGAWGVVGGVLNRFVERKYRRVDDGLTEGYAELEETSHAAIGPGETTFVLPLDEGIHRIENRTGSLAVSLNVYGKAASRGYVRLFDVENKTVRRALSPRNLKRLTAVEALGAIGGPQAEEVLARALRLPLPDPVREECRRSLERLHRGVR